MNIYLKILAFSALIVGLSVMTEPKIACASGGGGADSGGAAQARQIAPQTCDTQVWRTMTNRARMETEREIMQNQNLIFKPDSILAYTCFDSMAAHIGATAGVLFTHTPYWTPMPIQWGAPYGMDNAVNTVVIAAIRTYFQSNFDHSLLGGRGNVSPLDLGMHQATATASQSSTYSCGIMRSVWRTAKCLNFLHTPQFANTDGFYPFVNLQGINRPNVDGYETINETRRYPANMACDGTPLLGSSWVLEHRASQNDGDQYYAFDAPLNTAFTEVRERIGPYGSPGSMTCADDVPTGITVILSPGTTTTHPDGVCTNPGCTFASTGGGTCVNSIVVTPGTGGPGSRPGGPI